MVANVINSSAARLSGMALVLVTMLVMSGCGDVYVHDEFSKLTMNKSEAEVVSSIGKPVSVDATNPTHVTWTYYAKTLDVDNENKRDAKTLVIFGTDVATHQLKVVEVKYERG